MANRYWVGGTANWDGTAGTKWATGSGGAGGASVPTSADDVFFDAASGAVTVTVSVGAPTPAKSINFTGFTGTFAGFNQISVFGNVTFVAGMTLTWNATLNFGATGTLISAGKTISTVQVNAIGGTLTLGDALTVSNTVSVLAGTLDTANYNITTAIFSTGGSSTKSITLGSSTITISQNLDFRTKTGLTFTAGTSSITMTNTGAAVYGGPTPSNGETFYNVSFTSTSSNTHNIFSTNTFNNLTITGPSSAGVRQVTFDSPQTINGTLSTTGTAGNRRVWFRGVTYGIAQTLTVNATPSLTDADFRDIYVIGTAAPISGTRIGDLGGCRGITFDTPKTVYFRLFGGSYSWNSSTSWSLTNSGSGSVDNYPLAQDTAVFSGSYSSFITPWHCLL